MRYKPWIDNEELTAKMLRIYAKIDLDSKQIVVPILTGGKHSQGCQDHRQPVSVLEYLHCTTMKGEYHQEKHLHEKIHTHRSITRAVESEFRWNGLGTTVMEDGICEYED